MIRTCLTGLNEFEYSRLQCTIISNVFQIRTPDEDESKLPGNTEDILEGRKQVLHSIPKDGPLKFSIQGGTDTVHGGKVLISHIQEGGAAHK